MGKPCLNFREILDLGSNWSSWIYMYAETPLVWSPCPVSVSRNINSLVPHSAALPYLYNAVTALCTVSLASFQLQGSGAVPLHYVPVPSNRPCCHAIFRGNSHRTARKVSSALHFSSPGCRNQAAPHTVTASRGGKVKPGTMCVRSTAG